MSKMDAMRAMREARYEADRKSAPRRAAAPAEQPRVRKTAELERAVGAVLGSAAVQSG